MTASDDRLRELAREATPGPWSAHEGDLEGKPASEYVRTLLANREADGTSTGRLFLTLAPNPIDPERGAEVVPALTGDGPSAEANAAYIAAASPDVVLGLLDRLAAVEAERDRLAAVVERMEALAEELASWPDADGDGWPVRAYEVRDAVCARLLALLDRHEGGGCDE